MMLGERFDKQIASAEGTEQHNTNVCGVLDRYIRVTAADSCAAGKGGTGAAVCPRMEHLQLCWQPASPQLTGDVRDM
jgi:hypothetical protein